MLTQVTEKVQLVENCCIYQDAFGVMRIDGSEIRREVVK
jgi:hypothetical protein